MSNPYRGAGKASLQKEHGGKQANFAWNSHVFPSACLSKILVNSQTFLTTLVGMEHLRSLGENHSINVVLISNIRVRFCLLRFSLILCFIHVVWAYASCFFLYIGHSPVPRPVNNNLGHHINSRPLSYGWDTSPQKKKCCAKQTQLPRNTSDVILDVPEKQANLLRNVANSFISALVSATVFVRKGWQFATWKIIFNHGCVAGLW